MTPKSLTEAVADALLATQRTEELVSLLSDASPANANRIGEKLFNEGYTDLGLGIMRFSDAIGISNTAMAFTPESRAGFASHFNGYAHDAAEALKRIPGVEISDEEFWSRWDGKSP